jgi:SAM-dependent methyltransferase
MNGSSRDRTKDMFSGSNADGAALSAGVGSPGQGNDPANSRTLTAKDFAESFGTSLEDFSEDTLNIIRTSNFEHSTIEGADKDNLLLDILRRIETDQQIIASPERKAIWNSGWAENLKEFTDSRFNVDKLVPKFIRPNPVVRLFSNYVKVNSPSFELDFIRVLRSWLYQKYFDECETIYEFGCGTGHNLVDLAKIYSHKAIIGLDFVPSACELISKLGTELGLNINSKLFDMIEPDFTYKLAPKSLVYTFCSIEQLASKFHKFVDYIMVNQPKLCVHVEPIVELYDENSLPDYLAVMFHNKRGHSKGYLTFLKQLESEGKIELLKVKRLYFGSIMMEGYSLIIWRPKETN